MSAKSSIQWTDATWNPVRGCTKVSPGCAHCYAETFAERWRGVPGHPYEQGFDVRLVEEALGLPFRWKKPRRIFVNSMSDLFAARRGRRSGSDVRPDRRLHAPRAHGRRSDGAVGLRACQRRHGSGAEGAAVIYGSVCSGIEAASVAWRPLGWSPAWFAEIENFPKAVLAHRWPTVPDLGDFTKIGANHGPIDLLVGGTPCQSYSVAGLRAGLDDPRGSLMLAFGALARRVRARWVVWENVPGVLSSGGGRDFGAFLGMLAELGYGFAYRVLDAQFFGVAQRRRRVFVVGHAGGLWQRAAAVLFEPESLRGDPAPRREAREGSTRTLAARTRGGGGLGTDFECSGGVTVARCLRAQGNASHREDSETYVPAWPAEVAPTLNAQFGDKQGLEDQHALHGAGLFVPVAFDPLQITSKANRSSPKANGPCHTLPAAPAAPAVAFPWQLGGSMQMSLDTEVCGSLVKNQVHAVHAVHAVRRLTPRECERLQGFPDDYTAIPSGRSGRQIAKDGPRYKALGNSMAVPVMRWIGERIAIVDAACSVQEVA